MTRCPLRQADGGEAGRASGAIQKRNYHRQGRLATIFVSDVEMDCVALRFAHAHRATNAAVKMDCVALRSRNAHSSGDVPEGRAAKIPSNFGRLESPVAASTCARKNGDRPKFRNVVRSPSFTIPSRKTELPQSLPYS
jgi:hypothetical protein